MRCNIGDVVRYSYGSSTDSGVLDKIVESHGQHWSWWYRGHDYSHCGKDSLTILGPPVIGKWDDDDEINIR